jgi:hypothetical protein
MVETLWGTSPRFTSRSSVQYCALFNDVERYGFNSAALVSSNARARMTARRAVACFRLSKDRSRCSASNTNATASLDSTT